MRIAYLVARYPAINHTFVLREVRRLRALGFDVHVASISSPDRPAEKMTPEEREELAQTYYVKPQGPLRAMVQHLAMLAFHPLAYLRGLVYAVRLGRLDLRQICYCLLYFAEAVIVGRWMQGERLSHIHVHFSSTVGLIATQMFPITMSITIHGPDEFNDPAGYWLPEKVAASLFLCTISEYGRSQLMRVSDDTQWEKLEAVPLGIDPAVFTPRPFRDNPSPFEVFCVGRLAPAKGQHILIAAVDCLVKQERRVRLRLLGDGPDRAALEQDVARRRLSQHVVFEGWVNPDQVRVLCRQADAFAMASFAEGVPVVLMEAMAMAIPCVATQITGIPELIRDGIDGLLVTPSNHEELARAIARLMDDPALCRRLGEAGRQRVLEKYDLDRNTTRLADIFRQRLGSQVSDPSKHPPERRP